MLRAISASTAYAYTKNQRYLDIALEAFHKSKGTEKNRNWDLVHEFFLDRPDILFVVLDEILKEGAFLFYTDKIAMALGKAYASVKDRRILQLMDGALFYRNVLDFILNLTGESLSKRFKMNFYFF
ncbi:hypothetical protein [Metallosphaera hakonensis]|uniref:hypothetical protein n=1 Tax=Metallosphaera hakonensis TaxID=79601 RepID=UPI000B2612B7|nr:hypothetical protein [Metallosphaera hakonensis]